MRVKIDPGKPAELIGYAMAAAEFSRKEGRNGEAYYQAVRVEAFRDLLNVIAGAEYAQLIINQGKDRAARLRGDEDAIRASKIRVGH